MKVFSDWFFKKLWWKEEELNFTLESWSLGWFFVPATLHYVNELSWSIRWNSRQIWPMSAFHPN